MIFHRFLAGCGLFIDGSWDRCRILFAFGPRTFVVAPEFLNFAVARINGRTGEFTVEILDLNGAVKYTLTIPAQ